MGIFISEDLRKPTLRQSLIDNQYIHDVSRDIVIIYSSCPAMHRFNAGNASTPGQAASKVPLAHTYKEMCDFLVG